MNYGYHIHNRLPIKVPSNKKELTESIGKRITAKSWNVMDTNFS